MNQNIANANPRERFICQMTKNGLSPSTIRGALAQEGFADMTTQAVVQVQQRYGLKKKSTIRGRPKKLNN